MRSFLFFFPAACLALAPLKHLSCSTDTITLAPLTITNLYPQNTGGPKVYIYVATDTLANGQSEVITKTARCAPTNPAQSCVLAGWTSAPGPGPTAGAQSPHGLAKPATSSQPGTLAASPAAMPTGTGSATTLVPGNIYTGPEYTGDAAIPRIGAGVIGAAVILLILGAFPT